MAQHIQFRSALLVIGEIDLQPAVVESGHLPEWLRASDVVASGEVEGICELALDSSGVSTVLNLDSRFSLDSLRLAFALLRGRSVNTFDEGMNIVLTLIRVSTILSMTMRSSSARSSPATISAGVGLGVRGMIISCLRASGSVSNGRQS